MKLYSPIEISRAIPELTRRTITDLAEKGIVKPQQDTPGRGSARLYSRQNIFEMLIATALRGKIAPIHLKKEVLPRLVYVFKLFSSRSDAVKIFKPFKIASEIDVAVIQETEKNVLFVRFASVKELSKIIGSADQGRKLSDAMMLVVNLKMIGDLLNKHFPE